jgi:hypothetical protein
MLSYVTCGEVQQGRQGVQAKKEEKREEERREDKRRGEVRRGEERI